MTGLLIRSIGVLVVASMLLFPAGALAAPGAAGEAVHVVQLGESLSTIADHYGVTVEAIMAANGLKDPNYVYVGQKLVIPGAGGSRTSGMAKGPSMPGPGAGSGGGWCPDYYTVRLGDTLSGIAWMYGTTVNELSQANNLGSDFIYEGQKLCVPTASGTYQSSMPSMSHSQATYYTVRAGDTLAGIALRFGVAQEAMMQANDLSNPSLIYVDQRLVIPGAYADAPSMSKPTSGEKPGAPPGYGPMGAEPDNRWPVDGRQSQMSPGMDGYAPQSGRDMSSSQPGYGPMGAEPDTRPVDGRQSQMSPGMDGYAPQSGRDMSSSQPGYSPMGAEPNMGSMDGRQPQMAPGTDGRPQEAGPGTSPSQPPGYSPMGADPQMGYMDGQPSGMATMGNSPAPPPDYAPPDGVEAGVARPVPMWTGSRIAHNADPDGITTLLVLVEEGNEDLDVMIRSADGYVARGVTGVYYEYSWLPSFAFRNIPGGDYKVWIEGEASKAVEARVDPGWRATVDMKWENVTPDPVVSSDGWIAEVVENSNGSDPIGAFSILIVRTGATGNKIRLTAPGGFEAVCVTGTKPEHGTGACDFGGLNAGTYQVNLDGTHATAEIFLDGIGTAVVEFRPARQGYAMMGH